tara:strand:+ start:91 stop:573 length:483 start_codon:yes stop_codon:yes gene_type:complete
MSNILVQNIKHTNGTTSMVVDSSGHVATDTIKGNTTAGSISVVGEGNSTTTNLQQGLCKAWVHFNKQSNPELQDSFNISSLSDTATGKTTVNINNDFSNNDYACVMYQNGATAGDTGSFANGLTGGLLNRTTGVVDAVAYSTSALIDAALNDIIIHGDLA